MKFLLLLLSIVLLASCGEAQYCNNGVHNGTPYQIGYSDNSVGILIREYRHLCTTDEDQRQYIHTQFTLKLDQHDLSWTVNRSDSKELHLPKDFNIIHTGDIDVESGSFQPTSFEYDKYLIILSRYEGYDHYLNIEIQQKDTDGNDQHIKTYTIPLWEIS